MADPRHVPPGELVKVTPLADVTKVTVGLVSCTVKVKQRVVKVNPTQEKVTVTVQE